MVSTRYTSNAVTHSSVWLNKLLYEDLTIEDNFFVWCFVWFLSVEGTRFGLQLLSHKGKKSLLMVYGFPFRYGVISYDKYNYLYEVATAVPCSPSYFAIPPYSPTNY